MPAISQEMNPGKTVPVTGPSSSPSLSQDYANYTGMINQINSIDQLRDVSPQSWSYEALKNLVENYGCIVGYPDRTYRGDRPLTRNEFAAGLNACLTQIEKRILEARGQSRNVSSSPMIDAGMTSSGETGVQPGDQLINVFNRAFYNETERFYDGTNISGQANKIFGWRTFPGSFFDNQIANDAATFEAIYHDALAQQTTGQNIRTRDLANPFNTSLIENPSYLKMVNPASSSSPIPVSSY
jgi:hypothetical protein